MFDYITETLGLPCAACGMFIQPGEELTQTDDAGNPTYYVHKVSPVGGARPDWCLDNAPEEKTFYCDHGNEVELCAECGQITAEEARFEYFWEGN